MSADVLIQNNPGRAQPYQLARLPAGRLAQPSTLVTFFQNNLEHHRPFNISTTLTIPLGQCAAYHSIGRLQA